MSYLKAYAYSRDRAIGNGIQFEAMRSQGAATPTEGVRLVVEYPDGGVDQGKVISVGAGQAEILIDDKTCIVQPADLPPIFSSPLPTEVWKIVSVRNADSSDKPDQDAEDPEKLETLK